MIDQSHNIEPKIPAMIRSVLNVQTQYAKALLISHDEVREVQEKQDVMAAEDAVRKAFEFDVTPLLAVVREELGVPADPMKAFLESGYTEKNRLPRRRRCFLVSEAVLAIDLGASSGRGIVGQLQNGGLTLDEIHRFANDPVQVGDRLHWDILRLYHEIKQAILIAKQKRVHYSKHGHRFLGCGFRLDRPFRRAARQSVPLQGSPYGRHYERSVREDSSGRDFFPGPVSSFFSSILYFSSMP